MAMAMMIFISSDLNLVSVLLYNHLLKTFNSSIDINLSGSLAITKATAGDFNGDGYDDFALLKFSPQPRSLIIYQFNPVNGNF